MNNLEENLIYDVSDEYSELIQNKVLSAKLFITTFLGFIALATLNRPHASLVQYLRSERRVTLRNITEENNDFSKVVKIAYDAGIIRQKNAHDLLKLVYLLKKGSLESIDEESVRLIMNSNTSVQKELRGKIRVQYNKFISGELNIHQMMYNLRTEINSDSELSPELRDMYLMNRRLLKFQAGLSDEDDDILDAESAVDYSSNQLIPHKNPIRTFVGWMNR